MLSATSGAHRRRLEGSPGKPSVIPAQLSPIDDDAGMKSRAIRNHQRGSLPIAQRDRECAATGKRDEVLQQQMQRLLGARVARILPLDAAAKHAEDERRPSPSVQRGRPLCGVIGFDALAIPAVTGLIIVFDRVVSRLLATLGKIRRSSGMPPEGVAQVTHEIPIRQGARELIVPRIPGQCHDDSRLVPMGARLRAHGQLSLRHHGEACLRPANQK